MKKYLPRIVKAFGEAAGVSRSAAVVPLTKNKFQVSIN